ncbi:MAG: nucleotide modification associated domain-containing protein [Roseburia sp.]|nr:nucleotide modification associated domain-containing protein [Roseburia sp.]
MMNKEKTNQMNNTFESITQEMVKLHEKKDHDYGNAFGQTYSEFSAISPLMAKGYAFGLLKNKITRVINLTKDIAKVEDEPLEDSLLDLASYAIMTLVEMRNGHGK